MENSSKALLIAAAVLIVILLIAFSIRIFNSTDSVKEQATGVGESITSATKDAVTELKSSFDKTGVGGTSLGTGTTTEEIPSIQEGNTPTYVESTWKDNGNGTFSKGTITVKIGDYVNYTYDTVSTGYPLTKAYSGYSDQTITQSTGLQWRVMGINDNGELELISATPAKSKNVFFKGATGYNNGVYLLNDICEKLYSNTELGIKARSLTIEDIEARFSDAGKSARDSYAENSIGEQYGKTKTYGSGYNMYPTLYAEEANSGVTGSIREGGIGQSNPFYTKEDLSIAYNSSGTAVSTSKATASGNLMTTQTYYYWSSTPASYFDNETFHNMIFATGSYYCLASRYVACYSSDAYFGLRNVINADLGGSSMFRSYGYSDNYFGYLRPVVSLGSDVSVIRNEEANSATNMWTLSK